MKIPGIDICRETDRVHARFGLILAALQKALTGSEVNWSYRVRELWEEAYEKNVRLMQLIAQWPLSMTLELHVVSSPSLNSQRAGANRISLFAHIESSTEQDAVEDALRCSFYLQSLLQSSWPPAEFTLIDREQLAHLLKPFPAQSCISVRRRASSICLAQDFGHNNRPIGFGKAARRKLVRETNEGPFVEHLFPWIPPIGEDWSILLESLLRLPTPRWLIVRMGRAGSSVVESTLRRLRHASDVCERYLAGVESTQLPLSAQAHAIRSVSLKRGEQLSQGALSGAVLEFSPGIPDDMTGLLLGQSITRQSSGGQTDNYLQGGFDLSEVDSQWARRAVGALENEPFTAEEAACAFRLPMIFGESDCGLPVRRFRSVPAQIASRARSGSEQRLVIGVNRHRGISRPIELGIEDRLCHMLCLGSSGVGKSTLILSCLLQDARAGRGFALIDPPGELADDFLARFPADRADDLILVDFEDREQPVPMNLLSWRTPEERDLLIDTLFSTLRQIYQNPDFFGPVYESYFRSGLRLLLGEEPDGPFVPTLLELPKVFRDPDFRNYLLSRTCDEDVLASVREANRVSYGDTKLENIAPWINSKFSRFLQDAQLRRIIGHGAMPLDFRSIMDHGKIIIFKLAQGRLGKNVSDIILAQIVARFRLAAMGRSDTPKHERRPFFLYCDEFQVIANEDFAQMLSQCRKYSLVLLCYKRNAQQKGQQGSWLRRNLAIWMRRVAMERGLCRSARRRRAAGLEVGRNRGNA